MKRLLAIGMVLFPLSANATSVNGFFINRLATSDVDYVFGLDDGSTVVFQPKVGDVYGFHATTDFETQNHWVFRGKFKCDITETSAHCYGKGRDVEDPDGDLVPFDYRYTRSN